MSIHMPPHLRHSTPLHAEGEKTTKTKGEKESQRRNGPGSRTHIVQPVHPSVGSCSLDFSSHFLYTIWSSAGEANLNQAKRRWTQPSETAITTRPRHFNSLASKKALVLDYDRIVELSTNPSPLPSGVRAFTQGQDIIDMRSSSSS